MDRELLRYDASEEGLPAVLDAIWAAVTSWYAGGLQAHPHVFLVPLNHWRRLSMEVAAPGSKQTTIGIQEVMTQSGKRNAIVVVSPTTAAWLFFGEPTLAGMIKVLDKDWQDIGEIKVW
jgi:hypothetical protein